MMFINVDFPAPLERYTDSVRNINQLEALQLHRTACNIDPFLTALAEDMKILAGTEHKELVIQKDVPELEVSIDRENYARILENIFQNSLRFSKRRIQLIWEYQSGSLLTTILDDEPGFSDTMLKKQDQLSFFVDPEKEHMGMGLVISKILCNKHGGSLKIANAPSGGAKVHFTVRIH